MVKARATTRRRQAGDRAVSSLFFPAQKRPATTFASSQLLILSCYSLSTQIHEGARKLEIEGINR